MTVVDGTVRGWGGHGVDALDTADCRLEGLRAMGNGSHGLALGIGGVILDCTAAENAGSGLVVGPGGSVRGSMAIGNGVNGIVATFVATSTGSVIDACSARGNSFVGIFAGGYPTGINNVESSLGGQLMGMMAFLPLAFLPGYAASWILKRFNLLRVPPEVELEGLDMAEFQQDFFPEFERVPEVVVQPDGEEVEAAPVLLDSYWQTNGHGPARVGARERS